MYPLYEDSPVKWLGAAWDTQLASNEVERGHLRRMVMCLGYLEDTRGKRWCTILAQEYYEWLDETTGGIARSTSRLAEK
jgi:hypothetical protein